MIITSTSFKIFSAWGAHSLIHIKYDESSLIQVQVSMRSSLYSSLMAINHFSFHKHCSSWWIDEVLQLVFTIHIPVDGFTLLYWSAIGGCNVPRNVAMHQVGKKETARQCKHKCKSCSFTEFSVVGWKCIQRFDLWLLVSVREDWPWLWMQRNTVSTSDI